MNVFANAFTFWTTLVFLSWGLIFFAIRYNEWTDPAQVEEKIQEARRLYIETGERTREFNSLSRTLIATAERARKQLLNLELEVKEKAARQFTAVCACPKCGEIDVHWIEDLWLGTGHRNLIRRCRTCDHGWYQE